MATAYAGEEYARPRALSARASGSRAPRRCVHASAPRGREAARTSAQRLWLGLCARAGVCRILWRVSHSFEWRVSLRAVAACATRASLRAVPLRTWFARVSLVCESHLSRNIFPCLLRVYPLCLYIFYDFLIFYWVAWFTTGLALFRSKTGHTFFRYSNGFDS